LTLRTFYGVLPPLATEQPRPKSAHA